MRFYSQSKQFTRFHMEKSEEWRNNKNDVYEEIDLGFLEIMR